jgi:hypothetical protein
MVQLGKFQFPFLQAIINGMARETGIMFAAAEAFFLGRSHNPAVDD